MKLERIAEYITVTVAVIFGMVVALYVGLRTGGGDSKIGITVVGGVIAVLVALFMRANIWLLIPLFGGFTGQILGMSGKFPVSDLVVLYVFPVFLALKALKVVRAKPQYGWLDYLLLFNLFYLATAYIRNPVGTDTMGLEKIGGKPYFEIIISCLSYWVIGHVTLSPKLAMRLPLMTIFGSLVGAVGGLLANHVGVAAPLARVYSGFGGGDADESGTISDNDMNRETYLTNAGGGIMGVLYSLYSPFTTLNPLYIWRFLFSAIGIVLVLKSGFRNVLLGVAAGFALSCYFRGGISHILRIIAVGVPVLGVFLLVQGTLVELPLPMQRAISFLPARWDPAVKADADGSVEWRHEIWRNVWESGNKYITSWWFGDGFGMTKSQLRESLASKDAQENFAICGAFHSLPLTAIRTVGYVGFVLFCILIFGMAFYAWNLIVRCKGSPYFPVSLLFGITTIYSPLPSLILTGFYDSHFAGSITTIAFMRLISRSLEQYKAQQKVESVEPENPFPEVEMCRYLPPSSSR